MLAYSEVEGIKKGILGWQDACVEIDNDMKHKISCDLN